MGRTQYASGMSRTCFWRQMSLSLALIASPAISSSAASIDLTHAALVVPAQLTRQESNAVNMLVGEVEKRTRIHLQITNDWPAADQSVIAVGPQSSLARMVGPFAYQLAVPSALPPDGFKLVTLRTARREAVFIIGNDARGVLFGIGKLLRELQMSRGKIVLPEDLNLVSSPKCALRGHQLGYRPKCNSYDAWDVPVWEQYIRDLAVFGCNAIELIPPRSDDDATSPHFPLPPAEMMVEMSRLADVYGLDVWIWYPAMDKDYSDPKTVESALKEWGEIFSKLPRIDAVFVPGGDPGHTRPKWMMPLLEKQTANLKKLHPKAQMWMSPQSFNQEWLDEFLEMLKRDQPSWLSGLVFGPQVRLSLPRLRQLVPDKYPIRHYPDITHSRQCQYTVPDWDTAFAVTEARECINPRPLDETAIFRATYRDTIGFISYSEGCNDDVNKFIWSGLGWDPDSKPADILREYSRYFIGDRFASKFAEGLLALEANWRGPLVENTRVEKTLELFKTMEKEASPFDLKNWRFQQALFRAYYDSYTRRRLIREADAEMLALDRLRRATAGNSLAAMDGAEKIFSSIQTPPADQAIRERILELGEALFQSIGMQLSVEKYRAIAADRGASLDTLDYPLNDWPWLKKRFVAIRKMASESQRLEAIHQLANWTDPGKGGFYDDLGNVSNQRHLVRPRKYAEDPGSMESPRCDFEEDLVVDDDETPNGGRRMSWINHAETLYGAPLQLRYDGLDRAAQYHVRVVYGGDGSKRKIRLDANDGVQIHPFIAKPMPFKPLEFPIPHTATERGSLTLTWHGEPGLGGNGRNCQVSEVWLIKDTEKTATKNSSK
jgi:hypothetical protein